MKFKSWKRVFSGILAAIFSVTHQRELPAGELDTDLMGSSRMQMDLHQRVAVALARIGGGQRRRDQTGRGGAKNAQSLGVAHLLGGLGTLERDQRAADLEAGKGKLA